MKIICLGILIANLLLHFQGLSYSIWSQPAVSVVVIVILGAGRGVCTLWALPWKWWFHQSWRLIVQYGSWRHRLGFFKSKTVPFAARVLRKARKSGICTSFTIGKQCRRGWALADVLMAAPAVSCSWDPHAGNTEATWIRYWDDLEEIGRVPYLHRTWLLASSWVA